MESKVKASLLEPQSRGGDVNEGGMEFQIQVTLTLLAENLANEGFSAFVRESMGDTEFKFFTPTGVYIDLVEAKNHTVTTSEFWKEISRFIQLDEAAPKEYRRFILACTGLGKELHPIFNNLKRLHGPENFYGDSAIMQQSLEEYSEQIRILGKTEKEAEFLFHKVIIMPEFSLQQSYGQPVVTSILSKLSYCRSLTPAKLNAIYDSLYSFVRSQVNQAIRRTEIEEIIINHLDNTITPSPIELKTLSAKPNEPSNVLVFYWEEFFGGQNRNYPPMEKWNTELLAQLNRTRTWIQENRNTRNILLTGSRRLSAAFAFGWVFSAVAGFKVEEEYREGIIWSTNDHADGSTPDYELISKEIFEDKDADRLVVSIGIVRDISEDVTKAVQSLGLESYPVLHIFGKEPLVSPNQANLAVKKIKQLLIESAAKTNVKQIDLFFAGPSYLALFLGHRLNAVVGKIQCYEYKSAGQYLPTCLLTNA